jgi:hypothetical protein
MIRSPSLAVLWVCQSHGNRNLMPHAIMRRQISIPCQHGTFNHSLQSTRFRFCFTNRATLFLVCRRFHSLKHRCNNLWIPLSLLLFELPLLRGCLLIRKDGFRLTLPDTIWGASNESAVRKHVAGKVKLYDPEIAVCIPTGTFEPTDAPTESPTVSPAAVSPTAAYNYTQIKRHVLCIYSNVFLRWSTDPV